MSSSGRMTARSARRITIARTAGGRAALGQGARERDHQPAPRVHLRRVNMYVCVCVCMCVYVCVPYVCVYVCVCRVGKHGTVEVTVPLGTVHGTAR